MIDCRLISLHVLLHAAPIVSRFRALEYDVLVLQ